MADKMKVTLSLKARDEEGKKFFNGPLTYWLSREDFTKLEANLMDLLKAMGLEALEKAKAKDK